MIVLSIDSILCCLLPEKDIYLMCGSALSGNKREELVRIFVTRTDSIVTIHKNDVCVAFAWCDDAIYLCWMCVVHIITELLSLPTITP